MSNIDKLLSIASAEVGYLEKETKEFLDDKTSNAGDKNFTKYARDIDAIKTYFNGGKQGIPWCAVFVNWCFIQAFGSSMAQKLLCQPSKSAGAGCGSARNYFVNKNKFDSQPQPGDQIFFYSSDGSEISHTGIVEKVDNKKVYTIEGNTSAGAQIIPNGGAVCKKNYLLTNSRIAGYGHPRWELLPESEVVKTMAYAFAENGASINMRKNPSTNASVVAKVPVGAEIEVFGSADSEWSNVSYNGKEGYMMSKYISDTKQSAVSSSSSTATITIKKSDLENIRNLLDALLK